MGNAAGCGLGLAPSGGTGMGGCGGRTEQLGVTPPPAAPHVSPLPAAASSKARRLDAGQALQTAHPRRPPPGESCLKSVQTNPRRAPPPPPPTSLHAPTAPRPRKGGGLTEQGRIRPPRAAVHGSPGKGSLQPGEGEGVKTQPSPIFFYTPPSRRPLHSQLSSGHPKPLPAARGPHYERSCINVTPLSAPPASPPPPPIPPLHRGALPRPGGARAQSATWRSLGAVQLGGDRA